MVYGAPVEFKYQGSIIPDYQNIPWREGYVKYWWDKKPGLFDDVYTDLNFVEVFEKYGLDVSMDTIAHHWASTPYHLAHANQASRYNILNGIMPPHSGYWKNNPHADDLDFQIEADFIGLMAPGMVNAAWRWPAVSGTSCAVAMDGMAECLSQPCIRLPLFTTTHKGRRRGDQYHPAWNEISRLHPGCHPLA